MKLWSCRMLMRKVAGCCKRLRTFGGSSVKIIIAFQYFWEQQQKGIQTGSLHLEVNSFVPYWFYQAGMCAGGCTALLHHPPAWSMWLFHQYYQLILFLSCQAVCATTTTSTEYFLKKLSVNSSLINNYLEMWRLLLQIRWFYLYYLSGSSTSESR